MAWLLFGAAALVVLAKMSLRQIVVMVIMVGALGFYLIYPRHPGDNQWEKDPEVSTAPAQPKVCPVGKDETPARKMFREAGFCR